MGATDAVVTVIVATYGRPEVLRCALESVRRQSDTRWNVLVVGDCCPDAGAVVDAIGDPRVRFVNLPARQGEQSAPNSVGMRLATTPWVALLNHDDLWLPDHLRRAAAVLSTGQCDLYAGSAAFAQGRGEVPGGAARPVFSERTPPQRELRDAFSCAPFIFEPASSMVLTRDLARAVGDWRPATQLHRSPMHDWLLRAWRQGARFVSRPAVTTLKINTHLRKPEGVLQYDTGDGDHLAVLSMLSAVGTAGLRSVIDSDLRRAQSWGLPPPRDPAAITSGHPTIGDWTARLADPASADEFFRTGADVYDEMAEARGRIRGLELRNALKARTGETLTEPAAVEDLVAHCRRQLA